MAEQQAKWIQKARYWIAPRPSKPGVWRLKGGGYLVRGRAKDPRTHRQHEVIKPLPDAADAHAAYAWLQAQLQQIRAGTLTPAPTRPRWSDYAVSLLERKVLEGRIKSAQTRAQWASVLKQHLIPAFGGFRVDEIRRADVLAWKAKVAVLVHAGEYSPHTANDWLATFTVITNAAFVEFEIDRASPAVGVEPFDTSAHATYTDEQPNALTAEEVRVFLATMRKHHPQHFAMTALGFATGLRPSSLRPLRRGGPTPDVLLDDGVLLVRRSHTRRDEVMEKTKTGKRQRLVLPPDLVAILRWHIAQLPAGPMKDSELLFPTEDGGFRSQTVLQKPFASVAKAMKLTKHITPRAMRRTFQDLARAAEVKDIVTRAISGHATETMQRHYSTVSADEMREGLGRLVSLAGFEEALRAEGAVDLAPASSGVKSGVKGPANDNGRLATSG